MKRILSVAVGSLLAIQLAGCSTPAHVSVPGGSLAQEYSDGALALAELPPPKIMVLPGDTLRIVRDAQEPAEDDDMTLFLVRPDGFISMPHVGTLKVAGLSPEAIAQQVTEHYAKIYREPQVTVNIAIAPSNRIFVGGAVPNPDFFDLSGTATLEQVLMSSGGVLPTADVSKVALLRADETGKYNIYLFNLSEMLMSQERPSLALQRGDLVYVPKSGIGRTVEAIDMYFTRLFPINKGIGVGFNYELNRKDVKNDVRYIPYAP